MITGFNTDIEHEGVTYHVQTEDKGLETPLILSLVYIRGTILASKRSPYDDLLAAGFDEKILAARLQKQHKLICAAVRAGRIEELKQMTAKDSAAKHKAESEKSNQQIENAVPLNHLPSPAISNLPPAAAPKTEILPAAPKKESAVNSAPRTEVRQTEKTVEIMPEKTAAAPSAESSPIPKPLFAQTNRSVQKLAEKIDRAKAVAPDENSAASHLKPPLPPVKPVPAAQEKNQPAEFIWDGPVEIISEEVLTGAFEIFEDDGEDGFLTDLAVQEIPKTDKLQIELLSETPFKGGERKTVSIFVHRGDRETGSGGAHIMVKVLGSSFRPLIFHAKSDSNGVAVVHLQLPHFRAGRAAILVRAMSGGEETELRRVISHG